MLSNMDIVAYLSNYLNEKGKETKEEFKLYNGAGHVKDEDEFKTNGVVKQIGENNINSIMNYVTINGKYELELLLSVQFGFSRIEEITSIVNDVVKEINGKPIPLADGRIIFTFQMPKSGNLDERALVGDSVTLVINFSIEYSEYDDNETIYEMSLIDNPFDGNSVNTRYFESQEAQHNWYLNKVKESGIPFTKTFTPNINSLLLTKQTYINEQGIDINDILVKNYAVIRAIKNGIPQYYYYYKVESANVGMNNQPTFDLKLDTIQTYYFDPRIEFSDCFITRACLNRFVKYGNGFRFNTMENSPLFEREIIQNAEKRLVKREVVSILKTGQKTLDDWYKDNILGWIYLYINGGQVYNMSEADNSSVSAKYAFSRLHYTSYKSKENGYYDSMYNTLPCLAVPVYKKSNTIKMRNGSIDLEFDKSAIDSFIDTNSSNYIYSIKFSIVPPFDITSIGGEGWSIEDDDLIIDSTISTLTSNIKYIDEQGKEQKIETVRAFTASKGFSGVNGIRAQEDLGDAYFYVTQQRNVTININYTYGEDSYFTKENIVGANKNPKFNPKLFSSDYMALKISDNTQNGSDYDILKLGADGVIQLRYTEALTPDITKKYIRIYKENDYCIYNTSISENLTGFVNSDDSTLIIETDKYKEMLANNKNFFLQNSINRGFELGQSVLGTLGGAAQGFIASGGQPAGAALGAGMSLLNTGLNYVKSKISESLTVDNLKNAPNSINGAKGNAIFNTMYSDIGIVVETYDILPYEKEIINDNMVMFGLTVNKLAKIKDYDNIRKYFNYVEAKIENIKGISLSNTIREDIKQQFENGVRFWNSDTIQYDLENYEKWLED